MEDQSEFANTQVTGCFEVEHVAGKSTTIRSFSKYPLKLIIPSKVKQLHASFSFKSLFTYLNMPYLGPCKWLLSYSLFFFLSCSVSYAIWLLKMTLVYFSFFLEISYFPKSLMSQNFQTNMVREMWKLYQICHTYLNSCK